MSDPNLDAADSYTNLQALAFEDFQRWCDAREHECDFLTLADLYAEECASGAWVPHAEPTTPDSERG